MCVCVYSNCQPWTTFRLSSKCSLRTRTLDRYVQQHDAVFWTEGYSGVQTGYLFQVYSDTCLGAVLKSVLSSVNITAGHSFSKYSTPEVGGRACRNTIAQKITYPMQSPLYLTVRYCRLWSSVHRHRVCPHTVFFCLLPTNLTYHGSCGHM